MPEGITPGISRYRAEALDQVAAWLHGFDGGVRRLNRVELNHYKSREPIAGWRLRVAISDAVEELDLLLDRRFPRTPARILLAGGRGGRVLPHIEKDGALCVFPTSSSFAVLNPAGAVQHAVGSAVSLMEDSRAGRNQDDFRAEFRSYWELYGSVSRPALSSLLEPQPPSRKISVWCGKSICVAGEDHESVTRWLLHRFSHKQSSDFQPEEAVLVWLERALVPSEYPRSAPKVLAIVESAGPEARQLLMANAVAGRERVFVVLGFPTPSGPCFASTILTPPVRNSSPGRRGGDPLTAGFRPGHVPPELLGKRYFARSSIRCAEVERMDPDWVHGRGADPRASKLRTKRVTVLGCGSVGAPVAIALARAGVGALSLVDPELLVHANLGRHPLGADALGEHKAVALAKMIRGSLPHAREVKVYTKRWDEVAQEAPELLPGSDLIISAIGDWRAEGALNEWHVGRLRSTPIIYGWTEAHACAGHAIAIRPKGGCLQCGFSDAGEPLSPVVTWPSGSPLRQEPACGVSFQPYGPVELGYVTAVVAELALDCLLDKITESTQRTWIARSSMLESVGGELTEKWRERARARLLGGFVDEHAWLQATGCIECGAGRG